MPGGDVTLQTTISLMTTNPCTTVANVVQKVFLIIQRVTHDMIHAITSRHIIPILFFNNHTHALDLSDDSHCTEHTNNESDLCIDCTRWMERMTTLHHSADISIVNYKYMDVGMSKRLELIFCSL